MTCPETELLMNTSPTPTIQALGQIMPLRRILESSASHTITVGVPAPGVGLHIGDGRSFSFGSAGCRVAAWRHACLEGG